MDFILTTEGDTPVGLTHEHRFRGAFLFERSQGHMVADPDHCAEHVQRYADMGVDALVLRVGSLPHHHANRTKETAR
ncbi:hypothetical protein [Streptomyces hebeiensis]